MAGSNATESKHSDALDFSYVGEPKNNGLKYMAVFWVGVAKRVISK